MQKWYWNKNEDVKTETFFPMRSERGDPELVRGKKIFKKRSQKQQRRNFFSQRVVNPSNKLSRKEVQSTKTSSFKSRFDKKEISRREVRHGRGTGHTNCCTVWPRRFWSIIHKMVTRVFLHFSSWNGVSWKWASTGLWCGAYYTLEV